MTKSETGTWQLYLQLKNKTLPDDVALAFLAISLSEQRTLSHQLLQSLPKVDAGNPYVEGANEAARQIAYYVEFAT
jgi:hypothetical protein